MTTQRFLPPLLIVVSLIIAACSSPTPTPTATPEPTATPTPAPTPTPTAAPEDYFASESCPPGIADLPVECGFLTVPADYDDPSVGTMRLAVAVLPALSEPAGVPVAYLDGGPGSKTLEALPYVYELLAEMQATRDVAVFDQRGTGFSEPSLDCSEIKELTLELVGRALPPEEEARLALDAVGSCRDRLAREGIDLSLFHSGANAADVDLLRAALGYDQWDLYGVSYGTQLGQTVMRDFPDGVRRVALDSAYPLEASLLEEIPVGGERAFRLLTDSCAADAACVANYPDLADSLTAAVENLTASPEPGAATLALAGERVETLMTGSRLAAEIFQSLYQTDVIPWLPEVIAEAAKGNVEPANALLGTTLTNLQFTVEGMRYSTTCREEAPYTSEAALAAAVEANPLYAALLDPARLSARSAMEQCAVWDVPPAPAIQNEPVTSAIPTLVVAGEFDPITPPALGKAVADNLSASTYVEIPAGGHGLYYAGECPRAIILAFLDGDGSVDASCAEELGAPDWVAPLETTAMYRNVFADLGFTGARPEGWEEQAPGVFARNRVGGPAFIQALVPGAPPDAFLQQTLATLPAEPDDLGEALANGLTWRLFSFDAQGMFQAIAAAGVSTDDGYSADGTLIAVVSGMSYQGDALVNSILRPALEIIGSS